MKLPLHSKMPNSEIAEVFSLISQILGMEEKNRYRARAYEEASVVIYHLEYQLFDHFSKLKREHGDTLAGKIFLKELDALPGIGEALSQKLLELFSTGNIEAFKKYVHDFPGGMIALMKIHGIGAKKALKLAEQFQLNNSDTAIAELLTKAKHGQVRGVTGFGEKSEQELILSLEKQHQKGRIPYEDALKIAQKFRKALIDTGATQKVEPLGSLRRQSSTVGDIDLGVVAQDTRILVETLKKLSFITRVLVAGENLVSVVTQEGWQVDIKFAPQSEWGSFIQHFTGDKTHNIKLREIALSKGLSLSEHGIKNLDTDQISTFASEEAFYNFLGFELIPPNERVGGSEFKKYTKK